MEELNSALNKMNHKSIATLYTTITNQTILCTDTKKFEDNYIFDTQSQIYRPLGLNDLTNIVQNELLAYLDKQKDQMKNITVQDDDDIEDTKKQVSKYKKLLKLIGQVGSLPFIITVTKQVLMSLLNRDFEKMKDGDKSTVNFKNGIYCLKTGTFRERTKNDFVTRVLEYDYNPNPDPNKIKEVEKMIHDICNSDNELYDSVLRVIGYMMTGETKEQLFLSLYGTGSNGKSMLLKLYQTAMSIYHRKVNQNVFHVGSQTRHKEMIHCGSPVRVVEINEIDQSKQDTAFIKSSVESSEKQNVQKLYGTVVELEILFKLVFIGNKIQNFDVDGGIARRGTYVEFMNRFVDEEEYEKLKGKPHVFLKDKSKDALCNKVEYKQAIFHVFAKYGGLYYKEGLKNVETLKRNFKEQVVEVNDKFKDFLEEVYEITNNPKDKVHKTEILDMYRHKTNLKVTELKVIRDHMKRLGFEYRKNDKVKDANGILQQGCYVGLRRKTEEVEEAQPDPLNNGIQKVPEKTLEERLKEAEEQIAHLQKLLKERDDEIASLKPKPNPPVIIEVKKKKPSYKKKEVSVIRKTDASLIENVDLADNEKDILVNF
jgi:phage/plasmid-associated DNA primase